MSDERHSRKGASLTLTLNLKKSECAHFFAHENCERERFAPAPANACIICTICTGWCDTLDFLSKAVNSKNVIFCPTL